MATTFSKAAVVAALLIASMAHGSPGAGDLATARTLYREGSDLAAKGDHKAAVGKLAAARDLVRTPIILLALAKSHAALGQLVEAHAAALDVALIPKQSAETPKSEEARVEANEFGKSLAERIPQLRIFATSGASVKLDGAKLPDSSLGELRLVNPGKHVVEVDDERQEVNLVEREHRDLDLRKALKLPPLPVDPPADPPPKAPAKRPVEYYTVRKESPLVPIGFTVGAISLFGGFITGLTALGKTATLNCPNKQCPPSQWDALDSAKSTGDAATFMFVLAGVGAVTGITGLFLTKRVTLPRQGVTVQPWASPTGVGLRGSF